MRDTFEAMRPCGRDLFGDEPRDTGSVRSDLVDLALTLRMEKPLAIAVTDPAKPGMAWVWLPKSRIEFEPRGKGVVMVTLPERLAIEKRLV
jgi:hypothetical protein